MRSTRHPPFSEGYDHDHDGSRVVRLHRNPAESARESGAEAGEPTWRQAFVLGDGVIATRTPDRVIRARNGYPESAPLRKVVRACAPATPQESRPHLKDGRA